MANRLYLQVQRYGWALLVFFLPITSMPLVANLVSSGTTVAAPSGLLLLVILLGWLFPYILRGGVLPRQSLPLFAFILVALAATALSAFIHIPSYKENSVLLGEVEGIITLGIGVSFYLVAASWVRSEERMQFTLRLVNWSGLLLLLWCFAQALAWYSFQRYPTWMRSIHDLYSVGPLFRQRVSGFALEPSWLAHQLNMLYLPLWLAFSARRYSVHRMRVLGISFENILLVGGVVALLLTLSRVGLAAFLLMAAYLLLRAGFYIKALIDTRIITRWRALERTPARVVSALLYLGLILVFLTVVLGLALGLSRFDPRMAKLFHLDLTHSDALLYYANQLTFASRLVYWQAGWEVFNDHPWVGVGLGNAGFFLPQKISGYGWTLMEVRDLMYRTSGLLNIKSLWIRLLAETGIIGFAFFLSWLQVLWKCAFDLGRYPQVLFQGMNLFGIFVLLGLLVEGFSVDSFAMPYAWFSLGLLTAVHESGRLLHLEV